LRFLSSRLGLSARSPCRRGLRAYLTPTPDRARRLLFQGGGSIDDSGRPRNIRNLQPHPHPGRFCNIHPARVQGQEPGQLPIPTITISSNLGHLRNTTYCRISRTHRYSWLRGRGSLSSRLFNVSLRAIRRLVTVRVRSLTSS